VKPKALTLQNDEHLDFRIIERKASREDLQGRAVHSHEAGSRVVDRIPKDKTQQDSEE